MGIVAGQSPGGVSCGSRAWVREQLVAATMSLRVTAARFVRAAVTATCRSAQGCDRMTREQFGLFGDGGGDGSELSANGGGRRPE